MIHAKAGYYKLDVGERKNVGGTNNNDGGGNTDVQTGCLINNADLNLINHESNTVGTPLNGGGGGGGCYTVISSPKDYEITTTFPMPYSYGFYGRVKVDSEGLDSVGLERDVFSWERCEFFLYAWNVVN